LGSDVHYLLPWALAGGEHVVADIWLFFAAFPEAGFVRAHQFDEVEFSVGEEGTGKFGPLPFVAPASSTTQG
jgi:hypothetical protein